MSVVLATIAVKKYFIDLRILFSIGALLMFFALSNIVHVVTSAQLLLLDIFLLLNFALAIILGRFISLAITEKQNLEQIILIAILADVAVYTFTYTFEFSPTGIRGEYFLRTGLLRYHDYLTVTIFAFCSFFFFKSDFKSKKYLCYLIILCALSQDRIFLIWTLFCIIIFCFKLQFRWRIVSLGFFIFLISTIDLTTFLQNEGESILRILELVNIDLLIASLNLRFMVPIQASGYELSFTNFFLGAGSDYQFYIPWFQYRDLKPWSSSLDSFFITFFIKYGLFGVLLASYILFLALRPLGRSAVWIIFYLIVHNGPFVEGFLLLVLTTQMFRERLFRW